VSSSVFFSETGLYAILVHDETRADGQAAVETGLDNSTLLAPLEGESSDYLAINHARCSLGGEGDQHGT
jgi:hypothetical protein